MRSCRSASPAMRFLPAALAALAALALALLLPAVAAAQPFGSWILVDRDEPGDYYEIPHSPALNPTDEITLEGWVSVSDPGSCGNIIGKGFQSAWWVGVCSGQVRSYLRGSGSIRTGGDLGPGWHHFAVTFDGAQRCHYVDGIREQCWAESGDLTTNLQPVRIGSDVNWAAFPANGAINELRLWNVARSQAQIRSTINVPLTSPQPGLVAVWAEGGPNDVVGPHDATEVGLVPRLTFPALAGCTTTATTLCLRNRFEVTVDWRNYLLDPPDSGTGTVAALTTIQSGIFWFFNPTNWEVMVKILDGCPINDHYWMFSAATTNVFYRMEVQDLEKGYQKIYFNYPGPPAPAVTDTQALPTCP